MADQVTRISTLVTKDKTFREVLEYIFQRDLSEYNSPSELNPVMSLPCTKENDARALELALAVRRYDLNILLRAIAVSIHDGEEAKPEAVLRTVADYLDSINESKTKKLIGGL